MQFMDKEACVSVKLSCSGSEDGFPLVGEDTGPHFHSPPALQANTYAHNPN